MASSSPNFVHFGCAPLELALASRASHAGESEDLEGSSRFRPDHRQPEVSPGFRIPGHHGPRDRRLTYISDARPADIFRSSSECALRPGPAIDFASRDFAGAITDDWRQFGPSGSWRIRPAAPTFSPISVRPGQAALLSTSHQEYAARSNLAAGSVARDSARDLARLSPTRAA